MVQADGCLGKYVSKVFTVAPTVLIRHDVLHTLFKIEAEPSISQEKQADNISFEHEQTICVVIIYCTTTR